MLFVKFNDYWWKYDDSTPKNNATLYNAFGGKNTGNNISNCEIIEAENYKSLDWSGTKVLNNKYKTGWLDRKGIFYGCEYYCHDDQAEFVHHSSRRKLEKLGWIHISMNLSENQLQASFYGDYKNGVMPTDAQMMYLCKHKDIESSFVMLAYEDGNREKARKYEEDLILQK